MKGLLKKDWYYIREYGLTYLPLLLLLCLTPGPYCGAYAMMLALALPRSTIASDSHRWDRYAGMLPCGPKQVVGGKYVLCGVGVAIGAVITAVSYPVQKVFNSILIRGGMRRYRVVFPSGTVLLWHALIMAVLTVLVIALALPLYYRFGVGKGQLGVNILIMGFLFYAEPTIYSGLYRAAALERALAIGLLILLAAAGLAVSFTLSARFYQARLRGHYL